MTGKTEQAKQNLNFLHGKLQAEKARRATVLFHAIDSAHTLNIGRTEAERLTGSLRGIGELRAALKAYDAMEKK